MSFSWVLVLTLAITLSLAPSAMANTFGVCIPCRSMEECDMSPPDQCVWGEARDYCGRRICAKGPRERCGGKHDILGVCGEGLRCSEQICEGCSMTTMIC